MKSLVIVALFCVVLGILSAGCTAPVSPPVTPAPTAPPTLPPTENTPPGPVTDPALPGTWTIRTIGLQGGTAPLNIMNAQITAIFDGNGHVGGSGGCNSYGANYTLTGAQTPFGKGIAIGPVVSTLMFCQGTSEIEGYYFEILQNATSYSIDGTETLTIRDNLGSVLVYRRG